MLSQLEDWLERPMLILSFIWLSLVILELIWTTAGVFELLGMHFLVLVHAELQIAV